MSKTYSLGHRVLQVSKNNFKQDLLELIDFDEDLIGTNGEDYTREEALEKGFDSTVAWLTNEAIEQFGETQVAIEHLIDRALGEDDYYHSYEHTINYNSNDGIFTVFISFMSGS
jgi:hypothetical protein